MEASRGKRGKKAPWQVSVGVKDAVFAGFGVVGLMMISFVLGALAGRGDIYRVFYQWGLLAPETARVAQWAPPQVGTPATPATGAPVAPSATAAAKGAAAPVTGSIAAAPASPSAAGAKKGKAGPLGKDQKSREEELRRQRQEVVRKLKFQNSLDSQPKTAKATTKPKEKAATGKAQPAPVKVAQFRDLKAAKARMAELQKKGVKVTLKEGKDEEGPLYTLYRPGTPAPPGAETAARSPEKKRQAPAE